MVPTANQAPRIRTMSGTRGVMSGALRKVVAMLVRGQWVTLTIRVTRAARGLSLRGLAVRIIVADEGEGIDPIHLPCQTGRFCRVDSHRSREQGRRGWDWP
jgi:two-component system phosphate regulon sensor histidine kinase PhoR